MLDEGSLDAQNESIPRDESFNNDHSLPRLRNRLSQAVLAITNRVTVSPSSRVGKWTPLLETLGRADRTLVFRDFVDVLEKGNWTHPHKEHLRALVEVRTFVEIIEQLLPDLRDADLRDLVSGPLDPANEQQKSRARDREFELFTAAICRRARLPVTLAEPDVLIDFSNQEWAIAAKRLSSRKLVGANISKAASQIKRSERRGFVFLDVTRLLEPKYEYVTHWRTAHSGLDKNFLAFVHNEHPRDFQKADNGYVRGIVLRAAFPHLAEGMRVGTSEYWWAVGLKSLDGSELNRFLQAFAKGLRGV